MVLETALQAASSILGIRHREEPKYKVLRRDGPVEIRQYEPFIVAKVTSDGDYDQAMERSFDRLAGYIFGANSGNQKIEMTTPVFQDKDGNKWTTSFVMPHGFSLPLLPAPEDEQIEFAVVPERLVATLRYSGRYDHAHAAKKGRQLLAWAARNQTYRAASTWRAANYDPPLTLSPLRRNEVQVDLEPAPVFH